MFAPSVRSSLARFLDNFFLSPHPLLSTAGDHAATARENPLSNERRTYLITGAIFKAFPSYLHPPPPLTLSPLTPRSLSGNITLAQPKFLNCFLSGTSRACSFNLCFPHFLRSHDQSLTTGSLDDIAVTFVRQVDWLLFSLHLLPSHSPSLSLTLSLSSSLIPSPLLPLPHPSSRT